MMKKYDVAITETRERIVTVEATDSSDAEMKVREAYQNGEITLDQENIFFTEFTPQRITWNDICKTVSYLKGKIIEKLGGTTK